MSSVSRNGFPWSQDDVHRLRELAAAGKTSTQLAEALDRTRIAIKSKALSLGIALKPSRRRGLRAQRPKPDERADF